MNKRQFLEELYSALIPLNSEERSDILRDFEEHFVMGEQNGEPEGEIAKALGSPQKIAKELLATYHIEKVETVTTTGNMMRAILAVIGLGFFNLLIVLAPLIALIGIMFSGWLVSASFIISPLLVVINSIYFTYKIPLFDVFLSITLTGVGIFIAMGMLYLTRLFSRGFIRYLKFNVDYVKGGVKHVY